MSDASIHVPVLLAEVLEHLQPQPGKTVVDGTLGGGGHAGELAQRVAPGGRVLALDRDGAAVARAAAALANTLVEPIHASYAALGEVLAERGVTTIDGILLDLGLSSDQFADEARGFSFHGAGPLDMRFDPTEGESASDLLNRLREEDLANLIYRYGEERLSRRIARKIVERRREQRGECEWTAAQLADLVRGCVPRSRGHAIDGATRTFQALRIAVNDELGALETALRVFPDLLAAGGRFVVISFHSLEDRLVKHAFRNDERLTVVTKKPIIPAPAEQAANPRSRSAKLRVAERIEVR